MGNENNCEPLIFRQCRFCLAFLLSNEAVTRHPGQCRFDNVDARFSGPNRTRSLRFPRAKLSLERVKAIPVKNGLGSKSSSSVPGPRSQRRCRLAAAEKLRKLCEKEIDTPDREDLTNFNINTTRTSDNENLHKCHDEDCNKEFTTRGALRIHMRHFHGIELDRKPRKCPYTNVRRWKDEKFKTPLAKCRICAKVVSLYYLNTHEENHKKNERKWKKKKYNCPICGIGVNERWNLRRHFIIHLENNPFICKFTGCGARCGNKESYQKHVKLHFNEYAHEPATCKKCGITYRSGTNKLKRHKCITDPNKIVVDKDGRKYSKRGTIKVKRVEVEEINIPVKPERSSHHHNDDRMEVESVHFVDNIIETEDGTPIHLNGEELQPSTSTSVTVENGSDKSRTEDPDDILNFSNSEIFGLIQNDPVYKRLVKKRPEVEMELMGVDREGFARGRKIFHCSKCNIEFTRYCYKIIHERNCKKEKKTVKIEGSNEIQRMCVQCGFQAPSKEEMERHYKTAPDHGFLPTHNYKCTYTGCGRWFEKEERLEAHVERIHILKKSFKCKICKKSFATKTVMKTHMLRVHSVVSGARKPKLRGRTRNEVKEKVSKTRSVSEKVIVCKICDAEFNNKILYLKHKRRQHLAEVKPLPRVKCEICRDTFAGRHSLRRHIRLVHTRTLKINRISKSKRKVCPPANYSEASNDELPSSAINSDNDNNETEQRILGV